MTAATITTAAFAMLGAAIGVHAFAAVRDAYGARPSSGLPRWRPLVLLVPLFAGGYVTALVVALTRAPSERVLLLGTLCLMGACFVGTAARSGRHAAELLDRDLVHRRLRHDAAHDRLTGLPNRGGFVELLGAVLKRDRRRRRPFAVLILDVDKFKVINDSLGHAVGDRFLRIAAERIGRCIRHCDSMARLGSDEFVLLLDDIDGIEDAVRVADRVQEALLPRIDLDGRELFAAASIGIVLSEPGYRHADELLRDGDIALDRAKSLGGARYEVFDAAMRERMADRLAMEHELRRALEQGEFRVAYQPIVDLVSRRLAGFEALVRWEHPERGRIPPAQFIDFAESTGQIIDIDRWVLREACRQMREWQVRLGLDEPLRVSTNLSSRQFSQGDLLGFVSEVLAETTLAPGCLEVELTENAFIENREPVKATLDALKARGIGLKLDDFGTGYSSLSYLHRLPFDVLKLDRSFIARMTDSGTDLAIVHTVLALARALDIRVVAEGVETVEQLRLLRELKCEFAQGYLFSKPVGPEEAERLIGRFRERSAPALALA